MVFDQKIKRKYHLINATMNINKIIIKDANLFSFLNKFFEKFAGMQIEIISIFFQIIIRSFLIKFIEIL